MTAPIEFRPAHSDRAPGHASHPVHQSPPTTPDRGASPPHLRVVDHRVRARRRRRARTRLVGSAAVVVALVVVFGLVAVHVLLAQNQFQLDRLNGRATAEAAQYDRLRLQVAQLESPERVVATAQGRLGMVTPPKVTYLTPSNPTPAPPSTGAAGLGAGSQTQGVSADWARVKAQLGARP